MLQHFFSLESTFQRFRIMIDPVFPLLPTSRCAHAVYRPRWHGWLGRSSEQCIHSIFSFSFAKPRKRCGVQILKLPTCSKSFPTRKLFLDSSWRKKSCHVYFFFKPLSISRSQRKRKKSALRNFRHVHFPDFGSLHFFHRRLVFRIDLSKSF